MHRLRNLHRTARHHVLTPAALLAVVVFPTLASSDQVVEAGDPAVEIWLADGEDLTNSGTITAVYGVGDAGTITNNLGATIGSADTGSAVSIPGHTTALVNDGTIAGDPESTDAVIELGPIDRFTNSGVIVGGSGFHAHGDATSLMNLAGGTITGTTGGSFSIYGKVGEFSNAGSMLGAEYGLDIYDTTGSFTNSLGGTIAGVSSGTALFGDVTTFTNAGTILGTGTTARGAYFQAAIGSFHNTSTGVISSNSWQGVFAFGDVQSFINDGLISSLDIFPTVRVQKRTELFLNTGLIEGGGIGVALGEVGSFSNSGSIVTGDTGAGIGLRIAPLDNNAGGFTSGHADLLTNTGTIGGKLTAVQVEGGVSQMVNAGTLRGGENAFNSIGNFDDYLSVVSGSRMFGSVNFGDGADTLDFSGFTGNTVLDVTGLESVIAGNHNFFDVRDGAGKGKVAIFDITGLDSKVIGRDLSDINQAVWGLIGDNLNASHRGSQSLETETSNYAPAPQETASQQATVTAVLSDADLTRRHGVKAWGGLIGGSSSDSRLADQQSDYYGFVGGSHAHIDGTLSLGGLGGYVQTTNRMQNGQQELDSQTGIVGLYGSATLGTADVDFSLLGGISTHSSDREVVANNTTETAHGHFTSLFVAPAVGVSLPLLTGGLVDVQFKTSTSYVGGRTSAYTETGSSMNLNVGSQTIGVFDARFGFEGLHELNVGGRSKAALIVAAGMFTQANRGTSVPVAAFGQTITVATPSDSASGLYGGFGIDAQVSKHLDLGARLDGSLRTDGLSSFAARVSLSGTF